MSKGRVLIANIRDTYFQPGDAIHSALDAMALFTQIALVANQD